jgi:hypothetical protein
VYNCSREDVGARDSKAEGARGRFEFVIHCKTRVYVLTPPAKEFRYCVVVGVALVHIHTACAACTTAEVLVATPNGEIDTLVV